MDVHNSLCENIEKKEIGRALLQMSEGGVKEKELFSMNEWNFFEEMDLNEDSGAYEMKLLSVLIENFSVNDVRMSHKVHFDFN